MARALSPAVRTIITAAPPLDVLGHEHARVILGRAVAVGRPAQAYVFAGPDAVGKRTTAIWLAGVLNCLNPESVADPNGIPCVAPCGTCLSCHKTAFHSHGGQADACPRRCGKCPTCLKGQGGHPDVVEVTLPTDRATVGVESVRSLQQSARFAPIEGRWKVFLIAEAHRLTEQASNCLLKSLEEPAPAQIFILCTPSHTALLPTVLSRCQMVRFAPLETTRVAAWLARRGVDPGRADLMATLAGGRPGMALRLLDDKKAGDWREKVLKCAVRLASADALDALEIAESLEPPASGTPEEKRATSEATLETLTSWFRDLALLANGLGAAAVLNRDVLDAMERVGSAWSGSRLLAALQALREARGHLTGNANPKLWYTRLMLRLRAG